MNIEVFSVPKYEQNEDIWHIPADSKSPIVLCDGASESFNSRLWAKILSKSLANHEDFSASWLKERIAEYERAINPDELSWSKQMAYERGSFATFLSVQIRNGKCLINAAGDSEVFLIKQGQVLGMYPYEVPDEFLNHPYLLSTKPGHNPDLPENISDCPYSGEMEVGSATHILMLTDAIAHWLVKHAEKPEAVNELLNIANEHEFINFVKKERKNGLRLDDTTMIRIDLREHLPTAYKQKLPVLVEK